VIVELHEDMPAQVMSQDPAVHATGPEQDCDPHVSAHEEPEQDTPAHELMAEQSMVHALAALQSTLAIEAIAAVTEQGTPAGHVNFAQPGGAEHERTQVPALHVPASPHR
jgi:hypothetical protein